MTRPRIPLYGQILLWFFLNLALVALVLFLVLNLVFQLDVRSVLSGRTDQQFMTTANALAAELRVVSRTEWPGVLAQYDEDHGVEFAVYRPGGRNLLDGADYPLPKEMLEKLRRDFPPPDRNGQGPGGGPGQGPRGDREYEPGEPPPPGPEGRRGPGERPRRDGEFRPGRPDGDRDRPPPRRGEERPGRGGGEPPGAGDGPGRTARVFFVGRSGEPRRYWAAAIVSLRNSEHRHSPDAVLVASSPSLSGNTIFFDWRPWAWAVVGILAVSALIWLPFVGRVTRRLRRLTSAAESMSEGKFDVEVASDRGDELGRLSRAVQRMASRLDSYMAGQKRFLGDIAHELCSPLARLRMAVGVLESRLPEGERGHLDSLNEEAEELSQLVNELLDFSRASMKPGALAMHEVAVAELLEEMAQREGHGAIFKIEADEALRVTTNRDLLRRALGNVVRNANRYAGEAGPIELSAHRSEDGAEVIILVKDCGPGIPPDWLEKVFEPFSRPERARTREGGGAGLGLAIAKTCAEGLGGQIRATNRDTGGLSVELVLRAMLNGSEG